MKHLTLIMAILVSISVSNVYGAKSTKLSSKTPTTQKKPEATREIATGKGIMTSDFSRLARALEIYVLFGILRENKILHKEKIKTTKAHAHLNYLLNTL